jgi:hypothetical protein
VIEPADQLEVLEPREVLVDGRALAREPDAETELLGVAHHVEPVDLGAAAGGREQRGEDAHRGGLAGAVGPEESEHRALLHLEVDALERLHVAEMLHELFGTDDGRGHEGTGYRGAPT